MRRKPSMSAAGYEIVAGIVRTLPDELKQPVADHFATEFYKRSKSFDPYIWNKRTGGTVNPEVVK